METISIIIKVKDESNNPMPFKVCIENLDSVEVKNNMLFIYFKSRENLIEITPYMTNFKGLVTNNDNLYMKIPMISLYSFKVR